jgi:Natural resistance-associated macrophage protein
MVGDNDAGGVSTYAQAGQNYGYSLLWTLLLLIPVLIVNQEMVARLGAVTGVGHARLINERFGRFWGWFSVGDLFLLNFLTIVTEFIGVSLALGCGGVPPHPRKGMSPAERINWRMPPLALLKPVQWSTGTKLGVLTLRAYLVVSVLLLIVKAVEIGSGHG